MEEEEEELFEEFLLLFRASPLVRLPAADDADGKLICCISSFLSLSISFVALERALAAPGPSPRSDLASPRACQALAERGCTRTHPSRARAAAPGRPRSAAARAVARSSWNEDDDDDEDEDDDDEDDCGVA